MLTGSSRSNCSDDQKDGGESESEPTKQEVSALPDKQLVEESPGDDGISGLLGNKDSKELLSTPSPLRAQRGDLSATRQSFCLAMGNPSDFFVDVM